MAQEIVTWCDVHMDRDERVPAGTVTVSLNGGKPRQLDLCEECEKEVIGRLRDLLEDARVVEMPKASSGAPNTSVGDPSGREFTCPICLELGVTFTTARRGGMRDHLRGSHDKELNLLESEMGQTLDGLPLRFACDIEGCGLKFSHAQGLGAHKRHVHSIKGTSEKSKGRNEGQEALAV